MKISARVAKALRLAAAVVLLSAAGGWLAGGAHRGWTATSVVEMQHDEITGIEFPVRKAAFVPGVEFPAAGGALALALLALSFLPRRSAATTGSAHAARA
ncbi:hypothetical protein OH491_14015 [Termitidicoccus mucosus]|uniref:Uncharacterized protein n=1 Tax=Termitidicoccus mucosus TaxID=1184151 RepID=A0A178IJV3_9BACT|nr:hypothetical protein AW736_13435 [Opitutaceae bacterium TSB47]